MAVFLCSGSSSSEFLGGILGLVRPSGPWCFLVRQGRVVVSLCNGSSRSQFFASFLFVSRVSDVTFDSFWVGFSDSFVLQGHGVSPSGRIVWPCFCAVAAAATAAAAANFLQVFCSLSRVSDVTLESFWVGFSDSFVLQGHGVSPSCRAVWLCLYAVAAAAAANFLQVFCSVSRVSDVTLDSFWVGFSDSFVLQGHSVSPSGRAVWLCLYAVAAAAAANFLQVFCSVSRVSDVTWESFWVGFSDSFVLQGHHVSPSGRAVWPCFCAVAAAAAANFLQVFCSVSRVSDVTLDSF